MRQILFTVLALLTFQLHAADYYWAGGGGNWSDLNHWHLGSTAGPNPSIVPSSGDNVFFTSGSGFGATVATRTVTLDANGFCNNMTWETGVPNNPIFNTANAIFTVEVWGNMALAPTATYTCLFNFKGATPATITTNGTVQGAFGFDINKPGSSLTVTDSLIVPYGANVATSYITLTAGTFDITGKKVTHLRFVSNNSNIRALQMSNANATFLYYYQCMGANKTVNAAGSTLNALGYILIDNTVYNKVTNNAGDANNFSIFGCSFSTLTFANLSLVSDARIHDGNTVDTIKFMGSGSIGSNNNVNIIIAAGGVSTGNNNTIDTLNAGGGTTIGSNNTISRVTSGGSGGMGGGNTIDYWEDNGYFNVTGNGINNIDSLLLTPGKAITFRGTFNVNKYLELNGTTCDAFSEVSGDSTSGSLNFAAGATAVMNNMILNGLKAYGPITPLAVAGIDNGGNAGFIITAPAAANSTLYWVGGAGDWNDRNHWSNTSGGAGGACIPYIGDDVVFDANSGLSTTGTITTSSTSFCKNMTWTNVGNVTFSESGGYVFNLYGSLIMDPTVTLNAIMELKGSDPASITTNGSTLGGLHLHLKKTGAVMVTLTDNWTNTAAIIAHHSGGLNLSGRTVNIAFYTSPLPAIRSVDISNATLSFTGSWDYRGTGKSLISTGSHITTPIIYTDALNYPWVDVNGLTASPATGTTFGQLTFTNASATSGVSIGVSNTIRRLQFNGKGALTGGGNSIDTLLLAGSRNYTFAGTNTINKYLKAQSTPCAGLSEIKGSPTGTLAFASGAVADMSNIYMQNMTATGPITPVTFNGADAGGNTGWTISVAAGSPRYWIGGAGDWNDANHWSTTSGGAGGGCIPTVYDDVYFDANSGFTAVSKTVTVNNGNAYCHNVNWTGAANSPVWSKGAWNIEVWGDSVIVNPNATFSVTPLTLRGSNATYMKGGAPLGNFDFWIEKTGGSLTLLNDYNNTQTDFTLINGTFNAPGRTLNVASIDNFNLVNATSMDISNTTISTALWRYSNTATSHSLNAANSIITTPSFIATGLTYNRVNITGTASATVNGTTIDSIIFTNTSAASGAAIAGAGNVLNYVEFNGAGAISAGGNTINYLEFKDRGAINGTGNTINTLVMFPGKIYTFGAGTTTNVTGNWYASGTPCNLTEIVSSSLTVNATINKTNGAPEFDYIRVRRITAAGSTPFLAFSHTIDQGNNTNWNIAPYNGVAPIYGLGPDTAIAASAFPITLNTDGFFGNPASLYLWNNGSTADSLIVSDTGTYSVNVNFVDGCNINDNIHITLAVPLPVALTSFSAAVQNCQAHLNWKITDAVNFSRFVIEKSNDGIRFSDIGMVAYTNNVYEYTYTDKELEKGTAYYRLKLVDLDGKYTYSTIESTQSDCKGQLMKVYPTLTKGVVYIDLPSGYEQAQIEVYNALGQLLNLSNTGKVNQSGMNSIQLHGLAQGQYLLKVINGTEVNTFKIIYQP